MYLILEKNSYGGYYPLQSSFGGSGTILFPNNFFDIFHQYAGFVNIVLNEENQIINVEPNEELYTEWKNSLTIENDNLIKNIKIDPVKQNRADIDYLALMTGVDL